MPALKEYESDEGIDEAFDLADDEAREHILGYYESLSLDDLGNGFFHRSLESCHKPSRGARFLQCATLPRETANSGKDPSGSPFTCNCMDFK